MSVIVAGFEIDAVPDEQHEYSAEVTEHPVERGADVTDHVRLKTPRVTLRGIVSDTPIGGIAARRLPGSTPSRDAYAHLLGVFNARQPVTVITELATYTNMSLQNLRVPRDPETGAALGFEAVFVQIEIVTNSRTAINVASPRARGKVDRGHKAPEPAPDQAPSPSARTTAAIQARNPGAS